MAEIVVELVTVASATSVAGSDWIVTVEVANSRDCAISFGDCEARAPTATATSLACPVIPEGASAKAALAAESSEDVPTRAATPDDPPPADVALSMD
jgi:hypothetical protein